MIGESIASSVADGELRLLRRELNCVVGLGSIYAKSQITIGRTAQQQFYL